MKCYYHNDTDGKCAGAIVKKAAGDGEFIPMQYKDSINIDIIQLGEAIYIVDFSFKPEIMNEILKKTKNVCWIDHHATAFDYEQDYDMVLPGIRSNEKSGCELTWEHFYNADPPYGVTLIGGFDTWKFNLAKSMEFKYGLESWDHNPESDIWDHVFDDDWDYEGMQDSGEAIIRFRKMICKDFQTFGYEVKFEGELTFVQNLYMFGSLAFNELIDQYNILASFVFDGQGYTIGLYSKKIDVSMIAKKHGGGGHSGSAGFVCKELPF